MPEDSDYHPLLSTLRLYAGWLLACLAIVYALGTYQQLKVFPLRLDILDEWMDSPMLLNVTSVTFLFLMLSSVHQALGRGFWKGVFLTGAGFSILVVFQINM